MLNHGTNCAVRISRYLRTLAAMRIVTAACALAVLAGTASAAEPDAIRMRLDWTPWGNQAAFHLAQVKGWYKAANLDVTIEDGNGSVTTIQIVGNGEYDVGYASLSSMAVARGKGLQVQAIAGYARRSDIGVMVPIDSDIKTPKDLKGKHIGYTAGSLEGPFVDLFLKTAAGLTRDQLELTNLDGSAKLGNYKAGRLDGAFSTIPFFLPPVSKERPSRAIALADYGFQFPSYGLFATEETIKKRGAALTRFVSVSSAAWAYILKGHEDEAVQAIIADRDHAKLDPDVLLGQIKSFEDFMFTPATRGKPIGYQAPADWDAAVTTLEKVDLLPSGTNAADFYTNTLFDEATYDRVAGK
jgi:NitT/TauT family transport system substrate-binding protein